MNISQSAEGSTGMARIARVVVPGLPRHVTQRGDQYRFRWTGHLFQGRFGAVAMDKPHLLAAAGYIALNPMVARLVSRSSLAMVEHSGAARGRG
jgi:hypothetical protein